MKISCMNKIMHFENVVKTIGESKILFRKRGGAQRLVLAAPCFCEENNKLLKNFDSRWGKSIGGRLTRTTIIYIYEYKVFNNNNNNNNNNLRGGRSALPSTGLFYGEPVVTGEPGIRLAHSSSGLAHSLLPALCRQDISWAWRSRRRSAFAHWWEGAS